MLARRLIVTMVLLCAAFAGTACQNALAGSSLLVAMATEYANLPVSNTQLRYNIRKSSLIARGKIIAYEPPAVHDHIGTLEKTTITLEDVYAGSLQAGATLTYSCVCHHEESPKAEDMIGHEVLVFLSYDDSNRSWSPASRQATFFYHDDLRDRVKRMLRGSR